MCCRISTTGFATRTIAGLYIFLATFLIGFFAVRVNSGIFAWPDVGSVTIKKAIEIVQAPEDISGCQNEDGILITRWYDFHAPTDFSKSWIGVTNRGRFAITYTKVDIESYSGLDAYVTSRLPDLPFNQPTNVLSPQKQYVVFTESKDGKSLFVITFWYRINSERTWHFMTAYFPKGSPKPSYCGTSTMQP